MLTIFKRYSQQCTRNFTLYVVAGVLSLALSAWINLRADIVNPDAICYLLSAQTMTEHGFKAGMDICPQASWPFYPFLVSLFVKITHLSYHGAAYVLDSILTVITVLTFIAIVDTLGASKRVLWLAAAVILLSHEFNYVRQYIVRDHGFWAFYMLSLWFMLKHCHPTHASGAGSSVFVNRYQGVLWALAWSVSIAVATLFRIEGAIFMLTLPVVALFMPQQGWCARVKSFLSLNLLAILSGTAIVLWLLLHPEATVAKLGRVHEVFDQMQSGLMQIADRYQTMRAAVITHVLTLEAARDASVVLVLTLISWYLLNVLGNLSWIYSALVGYAWVARITKFARPAALVLLTYLLLNLIVTLCFFAERLFLAKRYLIAFTLTLMIWVPYAIDHIIQKSTEQRHRAMLYVMAILIAISAVGGIFNFGYSKLYIRDAGTWIASNVPLSAKLYVNDPQLMYYSAHDRSKFFRIEPMGSTKQYDYIALRVRHGDSIALAEPVAAEFTNKRGDKVVIYKARREI